MNITVETIVKANRSKVWQYWNDPVHIMQWAFASDDWECPSAENDLRVGGSFSTKMAAKDKSSAFDFGGTYTAVVPEEKIEYTMGEGGRKVSIAFEKIDDNATKIIETFEPEKQNSEEMQRNGWQSILNNFKKHVETGV